MEDYQERVIAEQKDLEDKIVRLVAYMEDGETFNSLPDVEQSFLKVQLYAMRMYNFILEQRIYRFDSN
jgi:hypothetical protein